MCWDRGPARMARPFSGDLRERIVEAVESGASRRATAKQFAVSVSCVIKLLQRWRLTGTVMPGQMGGWKEHALAEHEAVVRALVAAGADMTRDELQDALARKGIHVGRSTVWRFLDAR
ncbi:MAG TPA: IS630 family transposase, partial [Caulobacteraceae bacterium]|nr:IS630 family transposase [Caulobacteraceae bacterium]